MKRNYQFILLLIAVVSVGILSAHAQRVSPEDFLKASLEAKRISDTADKLDSDALEYCGSTHRALVTSSDVQEAVATYLLKPRQRVPDDVPASNAWMVRNRISGVLHFVVINAIQCATQADARKGARDAASRAMSIAANLASAMQILGGLALQQTKWQRENRLNLLLTLAKAQSRESIPKLYCVRLLRWKRLPKPPIALK